MKRKGFALAFSTAIGSFISLDASAAFACSDFNGGTVVGSDCVVGDFTGYITSNFDNTGRLLIENYQGSPRVVFEDVGGASFRYMFDTGVTGTIFNSPNMLVFSDGKTPDDVQAIELNGAGLSKIQYDINTNFNAGNDSFLAIGDENNLGNVSVGGIINMGAGDDIISITGGGIVNGQINGDEGNDAFTLTKASINNSLSGGAGNDSFYITDTQISASLFTDATSLAMPISLTAAGATSGDDEITVDGVSTLSAVDMGDGSDKLTLNGSRITLNDTLNGGDDAFSSDGWVDTLIFNEWQGQWPGVELINWENIQLQNVIIDDSQDINISPENLVINDSDIRGAINMGDGDNIITVNGLTTLSDMNMGEGNDSLILNGNDITFLGKLDGGGSSFTDTITFNGWQSPWPRVEFLGWETTILQNSMITDDQNPTINTGNLIIDSNSQLIIPNGAIITGDLTNNGIIEIANDIAGDAKLDIAGNYSGSGTTNLDLSFEEEKTDNIKIEGNFITPLKIDINRTDPDFVVTTLPRLLVVDAPNAQQGDIQFNGLVGGSALAWKLDENTGQYYLGYANENSETDGNTDGGAETSLLPETYGYAALPLIGREISLNYISGLHNRLSELRYERSFMELTSVHTDHFLSHKNFWLKAVTAGMDVASEAQKSFDGLYGGFDAGMDYQYRQNSNNIYYGGISIGYRNGQFETDTNITPTDIKLNSYSLGAYGTFFMNNKSYIDMAGQYQLFDGHIGYNQTELNMPTQFDAFRHDVKGQAFSLSSAIGHRFDLGANINMEPQAQITYTKLNWDNQNREGLYSLTYRNSDYLTARLGLHLEKTYKLSKERELKPWLAVNALQEFGDASSVAVKDNANIYNIEGYDLETYGQLDMGVTYKAKDNLQFYGSANYRNDFSRYQSYEGAVGLRVSW